MLSSADLDERRPTQEFLKEHPGCDIFRPRHFAASGECVLVKAGARAVFGPNLQKILPLRKLGMPPILRQLCDFREKGLIPGHRPSSSEQIPPPSPGMIDYLNNTFGAIFSRSKTQWVCAQI